MIRGSGPIGPLNAEKASGSPSSDLSQKTVRSFFCTNRKYALRSRLTGSAKIWVDQKFVRRHFTLFNGSEEFFQKEKQGNKNMRHVKFITAALAVALSAVAAPLATAADKTQPALIDTGKPIKYLKPITFDKPNEFGFAEVKKDIKPTKVAGSPQNSAGKKVVNSSYTTQAGDFVIAEKGAYVWAEKGAHVEAMAGSIVIAQNGATVTAHAGSRVDAYDGCKVLAKAGSTVVAENPSLVTAEPGANVIVEIE